MFYLSGKFGSHCVFTFFDQRTQLWINVSVNVFVQIDPESWECSLIALEKNPFICPRQYLYISNLVPRSSHSSGENIW